MTTFDGIVRDLTERFGPPTDMRNARSARRSAWSVKRAHESAWSQYRSFACVCDEERGVVVYGYRTGSLQDCAFSDVIVAPSSALMARINAPDSKARVLANNPDAAWVLERRRNGIILASPAVAIECAVAVMATEDTPLPGE